MAEKTVDQEKATYKKTHGSAMNTAKDKKTWIIANKKSFVVDKETKEAKKYVRNRNGKDVTYLALKVPPFKDGTDLNLYVYIPEKSIVKQSAIHKDMLEKEGKKSEEYVSVALKEYHNTKTGAIRESLEGWQVGKNGELKNITISPKELANAMPAHKTKVNEKGETVKVGKRVIPQITVKEKVEEKKVAADLSKEETKTKENPGQTM